ncbi:MAG: hypothetical protein ACN6RD_12130 [Stenotrophomonas maltophilia]
MNDEKTSRVRMRQLIDALDDFLDVAGLERNSGARAKLAIVLCEYLGERLDGERLAAVNAARDFWLRGEAAEYKFWFDLFSVRMNGSQHSNPVDRLVWSALAQSGGLDSYAGEYLALEAFDAGLTVDDIVAAIADAVPGFSAG